MVRHFFIEDTNTIIQGSEQNLGLNPILQIGYGKGLMRGIMHFDIEPFRKMIEDKTFPDRNKLTLTLKMTNCMSVDGIPYEKFLIRGLNVNAKRASSFDLALFELPRKFDSGRGFDYISDFYIHDKRSFSIDGSNWYCSENGMLWNGDLRPPHLDAAGIIGGIYDQSFIETEYEKYLNGEESIFIGSQHFDFGDEDLSINVTDYVYRRIDSMYEDNYGLCLAFAPRYESMATDVMEYVGFFNNHTNTFFHPYIEAVYTDFIKDDREAFTCGRDNRLYLYTNVDGMPENLDSLPICTINEMSYSAVQATKGVYYVTIPAGDIVTDEPMTEYDTWSNLYMNGQPVDDVELEFIANPSSKKIYIGDSSDVRKNVTPYFYGINDDEAITQGEVREITVAFRNKYTYDSREILSSAYYRLYTMDGNREIDIIASHPIEQTYLNNFFMIHTEDLVPGEYRIDIKLNIGRETKIFRNAINFRVVSNVTERYQ